MGEKDADKSLYDEIISSEPMKLDDLDQSEREDKVTKRRQGYEDVVALKTQNEAFAPFKYVEVRKFRQKTCEYETAGGNLMKVKAWISSEPPKSFSQPEKKESNDYSCSLCKKHFKEKKMLERHMKCHNK